MRWSRRRAEAFAALLDGQPGDPAVPAADPRLAGLTQITDRLTALPQVPLPAAGAVVRSGILAAAAAAQASTAATVPAPGAATGAPGVSSTGLSSAPAAAATSVVPPRRPASVTRLATLTHSALVPVATGALATAVVVAGIGTLAGHSLPGQPLYGLKRAVEAIQVDFAGGTVAQAQERLSVAATRLQELAGLDRGHGGAAAMETALTGWTEEVRGAITPLLSAGGAARQDLAHQLAAQQHLILSLLPSLPAAARPAARQALSLVRTADALLALTAGFPPTRTGKAGSGSGGQPGPAQPATAVPGPVGSSPAAATPTPSTGSSVTAPTPTSTAGSSAPASTPSPSPTPTGSPSPSPLPSLPLPTDTSPSLPLLSPTALLSPLG